MSNLTRLQTVSSSLDTAINKANALPDAGSGGGASLDTCTIVINNSYPTYVTISGVSATIYEEDIIKTYVITSASQISYPITIDNVICNSPITFHTSSVVANSCEGCELLGFYAGFYVYTSTNANATGTISVMPAG